jgi:hypothetical protein
VIFVFLAGACYGALLTWACMVSHKDEAKINATEADFWRRMYDLQREQTEHWFERLMAKHRSEVEL